jgi:hypothetical protein
MLAKLLSAKFAAVAAVAVLGAGTAAAAATGNLPTQRAHPVHAHHAHLAGRHHRTTPAGLASTGHSEFGLCTAYLASGQGTGHNASAPPFKALLAAHGGPAGTTTFCHAFVTAHHPGKSMTSTSSTIPLVTNTAPRQGIPASEHGTPARTPVSMMPGHPATTQPPASTTPATAAPPATSGPPATAGNAPVVTPNGGANTANSASRGNGASGSNRGTASGGTSSSGAEITFNHT